MSSHNFLLDMEKWHDYQIDSQKEIAKLLRATCEKKILLKMAVDEEAEEWAVIPILAIDVEKNEVIIDRPQDEGQIERIMQAPMVSCETSLDKVRLLFSVEYIDECAYQERPAFSFSIPQNLIRLQRRESFRVETPACDAVRCRLQVPKNLGGGNCILPVADIRGGGIALVDESHSLKTIIGRVYPECTLILPEATLINTALEVRNLSDVKRADDSVVQRIGCKFSRLSPAMLDKVQRYIFKLEAVRC